MPINFPDAPSTGTVYTIGDKTWTYDGTAWNLVTSSGSDHGGLGGLEDDDHTQYLLADGTRTATELTVTGDLTVDTSTLHVDSTNNRVGIGTTSPATALQVVGSSLTSGNADVGGYLNVDSGTLYVDHTNNRVGVGTTSPAEELHVVKDQNAAHTEILVENLDQRLRLRSFYQAGVIQYSSIQSEQDAGGDIALALNPEGGNVGVGTTAPTARLDVRGQVIAHGSTGAYTTTQVGAITINNNSADNTVDFTQGIVFTDNVNGSGPWTHAGIVAVGSAGFNGSLVFGTDGDAANNTTGITERMRINSSGVVTMPYQPAFKSSSSTYAFQTVSSTTAVVQFNSTFFNIGNHYSTSTYRFTAPVAGRYFFSANLRFDNAPTAGYRRVFISKNGANYDAPSDHAIIGDGVSTNYHTVSVSGIHDLAAGDYVDLRFEANGTSANLRGESSFSGILIG
jgi:hypothetical protein